VQTAAVLTILLAAGPAVAAPCAEAGGARACFTDAIARYPHGALGDPLEWGRLTLTLADGRTVAAVLPATRVFEDVAPRLADLDGDGAPEVVVVETSLTRGAQLAVYGPDRGRRVKLAATPEIGRRFRGLAPAGIADLDGDGAPEIAYDETPHLGKVLRIWRYAPGGLIEIAAAAGLSNHRFGEPTISGGIRDCGPGPEVVTADADWTRVLASRLAGGRILARVVCDAAAPADFAAAMACRD
jgi:hypothetical protein